MAFRLYFCYSLYLKQLAGGGGGAHGRGLGFYFLFLFPPLLEVGIYASISRLWATDILYLQNVFKNPLNTGRIKQWGMVSLLLTWSFFITSILPRNASIQLPSWLAAFAVCFSLPWAYSSFKHAPCICFHLQRFFYSVRDWLINRPWVLLVFRDCIFCFCFYFQKVLIAFTLLMKRICSLWA